MVDRHLPDNLNLIAAGLPVDFGQSVVGGQSSRRRIVWIHFQHLLSWWWRVDYFQ